MSNAFDEFPQDEREYTDSDEDCPDIFFVIADCLACRVHWAVSPDLGNIPSGNIWFFDAKRKPKFPPAYTVASNALLCPRCSGKVEVKSRYAMLTANGEHWLFLDKTKATG